MASRVGWRRREEIAGVREAFVGWGGGCARCVAGRRASRRSRRVEGFSIAVLWFWNLERVWCSVVRDFWSTMIDGGCVTM